MEFMRILSETWGSCSTISNGVEKSIGDDFLPGRHCDVSSGGDVKNVFDSYVVSFKTIVPTAP